MEVFATVVEEGSFAAAARRLAASPPAVTRAIGALEQYLGVKLLDRTTRWVRVTDAGLRYVDDVRRILADAAAAEANAAGAQGSLRGELAVTAPMLFGRLHVLPGITDFLQHYPDMAVTATFLDRVVNLLEEGFDVGVRIGALPDSSMRALRVGTVYPLVCAAPAYLARHGVPANPEALSSHTIVAATAVTPQAEWKFQSSAGRSAIRFQPRLNTSSNDCAIDAVRSGFGITRVMSYQVAALLARGELVELLSDFRPEPLPVHILHREGRYASLKIKTFVEALAAHLRQRLPTGAPPG